VRTDSQLESLEGVSVDLVEARHQRHGKVHQSDDNVLFLPTCFLKLINESNLFAEIRYRPLDLTLFTLNMS
jgi:hypothetical protein